MNDKKVGIEIRGVYDGVLFWWYPETNSYRLRFPIEWYGDIDVLALMEAHAVGREEETS